MTQEEERILLVDISARLTHGVEVHCEWNMFQGDRVSEDGELVAINIHAKSIHFKRNSGRITEIPFNRIDGKVLPYLRPMSSMTEEEKIEWQQVFELELKALENNEECTIANAASSAFEIDFYNAHHFDYRGLIEKGLALEVLENMYK